MGATAAGELLREARLRHGLTQEALAIRAGIERSAVAAIEDGRVSPRVQTLGEFLELLGEELILIGANRSTGIDLTLNQGNLALTAEQRVFRGLAFADFVRRNRAGGAEGHGHSLHLGPILRALNNHQVDFILIGSIAGLVHGSAYPTFDVDVAYAGDPKNLDQLVTALGDLGAPIDTQELVEHAALSLETEFGALDILRGVPGVESYEQLRRDSSRELIAGCAVQVASLNHLIAMKRAAGLRKDQLMVMEYVELADEIRRREEPDGSN